MKMFPWKLGSQHICRAVNFPRLHSEHTHTHTHQHPTEKKQRKTPKAKVFLA